MTKSPNYGLMVVWEENENKRDNIRSKMLRIIKASRIYRALRNEGLYPEEAVELTKELLSMASSTQTDKDNPCNGLPIWFLILNTVLVCIALVVGSP